MSSSLWRGYHRYFRPHYAALGGVALAGVAQSFFYLPFAALLRRMFDVILPAKDIAGLWEASLAILALQLAGLGLAYWVRITSLRISEDLTAGMRSDAIERLYQLPRTFYTGADLEKLHVTLVYETNLVGAMSRALAGPAITGVLGAAMLFCIMFAIQPKLALVIAIAAPALFIVNRWMTRSNWFRMEALRTAFENFSRGVRFVLSAMDLTRAQASEGGELGRQRGNIQALRGISIQLTRFDAGQELLQGGLMMAATLAVLVAGGYAVAEEGVTRGEMMAFYVLAAMFAAQTRSIVGAMPEIRMGMRAFREVYTLLDRTDREPYTGTRRISRIEEIRLEGVHFAYPGCPPLLEGVTLSIPRGGRVVLLGPNGCGKTSIVHLIGGYYRPDRGELRVNGVAYEEIDLRSLRGRTALVPQNPLLFAGTLGENLLYGKERDAGPEAVAEALESAGLKEFIDQLPDGLETAVGEQGIRLSGGQRQRLAIARALLRKPDLLIFDEPTNHLDEAAIVNLSARLRDLPYHPAVLLISHEPRILRHADVAWRIENGRLEPAGIKVPR